MLVKESGHRVNAEGFRKWPSIPLTRTWQDGRLGSCQPTGARGTSHALDAEEGARGRSQSGL